MALVGLNAFEQPVDRVLFTFQILHIDAIHVTEHPGNFQGGIDTTGPFENGRQILVRLVVASAGDEHPQGTCTGRAHRTAAMP